MRVVILVIVFFITACTAKAPSLSLYERLGGEEGVDDIVYQLIVNISRDERVVDRFKGVDIEKFRTGLVHYICSVSNGGCIYTGDSMQVVHAGHNYTDTEFNAIVENLIHAMDHQRVPTAVQNKLLAQLAKDYGDVVYQ
ncbi:group 1 truncated hemoglobin [Gilvimarinus sp. SDUM040013]|uniref:Group 1 truncated hemoglobin n=1 Tax=Gilvimarinus gilvus TaxID=3058038 RepID=A0ABU4S1V2_9GAMM|nr:group 1 truncated hemoglobin [Gilvimarinus sp. SDUM040013]MDO3388092.1 group 1 truncated hemoglobin [Gilvimarinus sp. SDUM040013]MDX6851000.1 group 1 truncated hemoglobin [Gilvimarinus sp. SDUM040013]